MGLSSEDDPPWFCKSVGTANASESGTRDKVVDWRSAFGSSDSRRLNRERELTLD